MIPLPETPDNQDVIQDTVVVPIVAETAQVEKRTVETGTVRIVKKILESEEVVDEPLRKETVSVERIPVNKVVDGPIEVRRESDGTWIVPVLEERLVVEKRLFLVEELHITRREHVVHEPQTVRLKKEEITVERSDNPDAPERNIRETEG